MTVRYRADAVVPCVEPGVVLRPGVVEVADGVITHVGPEASATVAEEVVVSGALLPGLINTHCHSPMTLFRGAGGGLPLERWLGEVVWPREANLEAEDVYWGMTLAVAELLRFGVTTSCEMYFHEDAIADAVLAAGTRAVITPGVLQLPGRSRDGAWWEPQLDVFTDFHRRRQGEAGRIDVGFAAHAPYSVPMEGLAAAAEAARSCDTLFHLHLAETEMECTGFLADHGTSEPLALESAGVLEGRVLAAHGVWLDDDDISCLARHDVAVAHCPQSNAKLASGMAPVTGLLAAGVTVALGTDGPGSNNDLDLWEDMRTAAFLARLRERDASALLAAGALDLATRAGGAALGRPDLGVLSAGTPADMIAFDLDDPVFVPWLEDDELFEHLVWAASGRLVTDVWVAGRQVVRAGSCLTVDVEEARRQVETRARRLMEVQ